MTLIIGYSVVTFAMRHPECRYDNGSGDDSEPNELPNVTIPITLSLIVGLLLHVTLFVSDVFLESHLRFYRVP